MSENVINLSARRQAPELGVVMQLAAEAGSETKRLISADPYAIHGEHRDLIINGLRAIYAGQYGEDYHGVSSAQAAAVLDHYEWPLEAESA